MNNGQQEYPETLKLNYFDEPENFEGIGFHEIVKRETVIDWMKKRKHQTLVIENVKMEDKKLAKKIEDFSESLQAFNSYFPKEDKSAYFLVLFFELKDHEFQLIFGAAKNYFQEYKVKVLTYVEWSSRGSVDSVPRR